jgi:hypothetical protein
MAYVEGFQGKSCLFRYFIWLVPPFPLVSDFAFDRGQERSHRKSLFIRHESGVWAVLPRQWALVKEANKRLPKKSTKADELRVVHVALKEEVA